MNPGDRVHSEIFSNFHSEIFMTVYNGMFVDSTITYKFDYYFIPFIGSVCHLIFSRCPRINCPDVFASNYFLKGNSYLSVSSIDKEFFLMFIFLFVQTKFHYNFNAF